MSSLGQEPTFYQNYNIDQSDKVYMYVSCTYVLKGEVANISTSPAYVHLVDLWSIIGHLHLPMIDHEISADSDHYKTLFTIYGHGSHLGYVTHLICIYFHPHSPISLHMNFSFTDLTFSVKNKFKFCNLSDLHLWYSFNFINSFTWIFKQTLKPIAAILSKQEGHVGPGLLTWVLYEPRIFKLPDFGVK